MPHVQNKKKLNTASKFIKLVTPPIVCITEKNKIIHVHCELKAKNTHWDTQVMHPYRNGVQGTLIVQWGLFYVNGYFIIFGLLVNK